MSLFNYKATVLEIVDGDTFSANVDLGFGITVQPAGSFDLGRFRLYGIDTPETTHRKPGLTDAQWEAEKVAGLKAKERLTQITPKGTVIWVESRKPDKYGRWLCLAYVRQEDLGDVARSINAQLVREGFAKLYASEPLKL
jgi:endonuclease YncB( thermonuclease family)